MDSTMIEVLPCTPAVDSVGVDDSERGRERERRTVENVGDEWRDVDDMLITTFIPSATLSGVETSHAMDRRDSAESCGWGEEAGQGGYGALWHSCLHPHVSFAIRTTMRRIDVHSADRERTRGQNRAFGRVSLLASSAVDHI
jgi:hypothetical protein